MLYVSSCGAKGRGVFSDAKIQRGEVIERCPVLEISASELGKIDTTILYNYYFSWGKESSSGAIALGLGSIYNHSYTPNAVYITRQNEQIIEFRSIKKILANEEITINYNGSPNDHSPLWNSDTINWIE